MEFPTLGSQCEWTDCKILSFLPVTCNLCFGKFCENHFNPLNHNCKSYVSSSAKEDGEAGFNVKCSMTDCSTSDITEMLCQKCQRHYCLHHRYHNCHDYVKEEELLKERVKAMEPARLFNESLASVSSEIDKKLEKLRSSDKMGATARKVQLMKLKGKANGEKLVPNEDRVFFLVRPPRSLQKQPLSVYVSKNWSVGRSIDSIAKLCGATNRNNIATADKLLLYQISGETPVSSDLSSTIASLLETEVVCNGDSLILEYTSANELIK